MITLPAIEIGIPHDLREHGKPTHNLRCWTNGRPHTHRGCKYVPPRAVGNVYSFA
jgi:hypothetical protein